MRTPSAWGIAGSPIEHSITPELFEIVGGFVGVSSAESVRLETKDSRVVHRYVSEVEGDVWLSCTSPLKHSLYSSVQGMENQAESANQIMKRNGHCILADTDGPGFLLACRECGIDPKGSSIMIRGGGSTARSVAVAWAKSGGLVVPAQGRRTLSLGDWSSSMIARDSADIGVDFDAEPGGGIGADLNVGTMVQASYGAGWSSDDFAIKFVVSQHLLSWGTLYAPQLSDSLPSIGQVCSALSR